MPNIVVIGASAGGIDALKQIVRHLPEELPAAIFVVIHLSPVAPSLLPNILDNAGLLRAGAPRNGEPIEPGRIYVAPPDHHMLIEPAQVRLTRGPRENRHRPAIDVTMRTAARAYGRRVVGIVLTGLLGDGTAGLQIIKSEGGVTVVQDPREAVFDSMPLSAIRNVDVDFVLPLADIPKTIVELARESWTVLEPVHANEPQEAPSPEGEHMREDERIVGKPSAFTCPDCNGALWELKDGDVLRFRCRIGHAFSEDAMRVGYSDGVEGALWSAVRVLEEGAALERRLADDAVARGHTSVAAGFTRVARDRQQQADLIRRILLKNGRSSEPKAV